jgi:Peptidase family M23
MRTSYFLSWLAFVIMVPRLLPAQNPDPDRILTRAVTALGGRAALARHQTLAGRGRVEVLGGYVGPYRIWRRAPNRLRTTWDIGVIHHDLGFDGRSGWERALTVRELPALDSARVGRRAVFQELLWHLDQRHPLVQVPAGGDTAAVRFTQPEGLDETFWFDPGTGLPVRQVRRTRYEEGIVDLEVRYGDWRRVGDLMLPHEIREGLLELPLTIRIEEYQLDLPLPDSLFTNPEAAHWDQPLAVSLTTIPKNIYKESDGGEPNRWYRSWGIPFGPTESWLVNVVAREQYGRQVTPLRARVELLAGPTVVKSMDMGDAAITAGKKYPVARFYPQDEIFHIRHHFTEFTPLAIDAMRYTLWYRRAPGGVDSSTLVIPVTRYRTKTNLIAPMKGNLIAMTGHEFYELAHKYEWSQQFSWDFVGLGPQFELERPEGAGNERWFTYGHELVAPGDGVVVYARNDVPDMMPPSQYLKLPDPQWAIGGNSVLIDHGNGEISCLFHMKQGSVRVRIGDRVVQGQVIGLVGSSGSPGTPHTHYQLQAEPRVFGADALPVQFTNLTRARWLPGATVVTPIRGIYLLAR